VKEILSKKEIKKQGDIEEKILELDKGIMKG